MKTRILQSAITLKSAHLEDLGQLSNGAGGDMIFT